MKPFSFFIILILTDIFYLAKHFYVIFDFFFVYCHRELFISLTCYFELKIL